MNEVAATKTFKYQKVSLYIMTSGKMIHLRVPENVYSKLEKTSRNLYFDSVQGLIKDVLRSFILEMNREEALEWLEKNKGAMKGKTTGLQKGEREALTQKYINSNSDIFRKYNLR